MVARRKACPQTASLLIVYKSHMPGYASHHLTGDFHYILSAYVNLTTIFPNLHLI